MKKSANKHSFYAESDIEESLKALLENEPPRAKSRIINDLMRAGMPSVLKDLRDKRKGELARLEKLTKQSEGKS